MEWHKWCVQCTCVCVRVCVRINGQYVWLSISFIGQKIMTSLGSWEENKETSISWMPFVGGVGQRMFRSTSKVITKSFVRSFSFTSSLFWIMCKNEFVHFLMTCFFCKYIHIVIIVIMNIIRMRSNFLCISFVSGKAHQLC